MTNRIVLPESRLRAKRKQQRARFIYAGAFLFLLLVCGAVALLYAPFWRVTTVVVEGEKTLPEEALRKVGEDALRGRYAFVFPKNNALLYPKVATQTELQKTFPSIREASVHLANIHTLVLTVSERESVAVWCEAGDAQCLLLDQGGIAYAPAGDTASTTYVRYYGVLSGDRLPKQFLAAQQFPDISALITALSAAYKKDSIFRVSVDANQDVKADFVNGGELVFALSQSPAEVLEHFSLALSAEPFASKSLADFLYLDLRFGDKLYYKAKVQ